MKKVFWICALSGLMACNNKLSDEGLVMDSFVEYVNPYIGSDYHGHVFVGANVPFGAVQLGPDNFHKGWDWCSGYHYSDSIVKGFSHTHLSGTGCADLGDILVMPTVGALFVSPGSQQDISNGYASLYSHDNEVVKPGYYSLMLDKYGIKAELTTTARVGFHKYTFPKSENAHIIIDLKEGISDKARETFIKRLDAKTIVGYRISDGWSADQRVYFAMQVSKDLHSFEIYDDTSLLEGESGQSNAMKGVLKFSTEDNESVHLKVGISPVSWENALENIRMEIPHWDFEKVRADATDLWNKELGKIQIQADSSTKVVFYTALYHTMIAPVLYNDVNGEYLGADKKKYQSKDFENYTTFSLWDTYRAANPLFTLTQAERVPHFIKTMLELYKQEGKLPEWHLMGHDNRVMIGYNAVPVIVDAWFKGIRDFDTQLAYEAMVNTAMRDDRGLKFVKEMEYIPFDKEYESVAKAMEYAIYDWGIAQMAKELGKSDDYEYFKKRSMYYRHYFDASDGFFKGKKADGSWRKDFDPIASSHRTDEFCEGNGWQYLWLVPQNVEDLIELLGGREIFVSRLDSLFSITEPLREGASVDISGLIGMYAQGNEPGHHIPYLYAFAGAQWKTAARVRQIMAEMYTDKPDGLCGNEDCGQMSAWYIWSALGMYPVNPMNGAYVFGSPVLNKAKIKLSNGKTFSMTAHDNSPENIYIQKVAVNGKPWPKSFITHRDILAGAQLEFWMGAEPNKAFGAEKVHFPQSVMY